MTFNIISTFFSHKFVEEIKFYSELEDVIFNRILLFVKGNKKKK